jgi:hypothetical protein
MCRPKGRRCPGQNTPEHRQEVNAKRRQRYASQKAKSVSAEKESSASPDTGPSLHAVLPVTTGKEMSGFEFKSRLPKAWNPKSFKKVGNGFAPGHHTAGEKPTGGLWSSPIERDEDMEVSAWDDMYQVNPKTSTSINHDVTFADDANILIVDSREDYDRLLKECGHKVDGPVYGKDEQKVRKTAVDYEKLSGSFDAVYFTTKAVYANGRSNPFDSYYDTKVSLTNLDIASLYIMNPKAVNIKQE